ncbi:hypothetical protein CHS0354_006966 [Potamilus streckersoni]|uniref:ADP/ATP translocase n=1 Tax=Potamilus streckersoni TaxID=2493646 RepID=A0AAE0RWH3_9BIVA|nr:hypothetical protein CHS0354_006966 [Potamilus streckersoni]
MSEEKKFKVSFIENFLLSGIAAAISKTGAAPIERVKLLVQNQGEMLKTGRLTDPYRGVIDCTIRTYKAEGILSFWRGNLVNCIRYFPTEALNFAFKDAIKDMFKKSKDDSYAMEFTKNVMSGGIAGGMSLSLVYSLDYARTRLANDLKSAEGGERQFKGLIDVYRKTLASDGIVGLYRGYTITCMKIFVYRGLYFGMFDTLKPVLLGENADIATSFAIIWGVTITAGLISYPFDTISRRMMMASGEAVKYKGSIVCTVQILKNEGFLSLMKGAGVNILRGFTAAGFLAGAEELKKYYIKWQLSSMK